MLIFSACNISFFSFIDCIHGTGPAYFKHVCTLVSDISGRAHLCSDEQQCVFLAPELSSADGVFQLLRRPSGTLWAHLRSTLISRRQFAYGLKSHLFADAYF